ncbi:MAG: NAD(P)-dependent oxidoreductase [Synechococcus sp.]
MKIALLGANGKTGRQIIGRALDAGDTVTALVRTEDRLADVTHKHLNVRIANVCNSDALKAVLPEHDIVISTLGPRKPTKTACAIYSESATAIVEAMQQSGVTRLIVMSTALLFPSDKLSDRVLNWIAKHNAQSAKTMEETIRTSNLDWTIVRTGFLNSNNSTEYRTAVGAFPDGGGSISRAAVARFLLTEARECKHLRQIVGLCG